MKSSINYNFNKPQLPYRKSKAENDLIDKEIEKC